MGSCEDDGCVDLLPPDHFAVIAFDPNRSPWKGPYWGRPSAFPNQELEDLLNAMISTASQPTLLALGAALVNAAGGASALAALIAPHLNVNIMCSGCDCTCTGTVS
jgi:hypothetical protein